MKTSGFSLACMAVVLVLPGCNFHRFDDDLTGPDFPPQCSIGAFYVESAMLTTAHGGYVDLRLGVKNADGGAPAFSVHADITARAGDQIIGGTSVDFNVLNEGESADVSVDVPVSGIPDEVDCTLSWQDDSGSYYSTGAVAGIYGALLKPIPPKG